MNATFGTLENRKLLLAPGLNILEGPNESGKSTWCSFIRAMLYGINSSERDTKTSIAAKNRYKPWCGAPMSGTMRLMDDSGREITLERRGSAASPLRELTAYDRAGEPVNLSDGTAGEILLGIGLETFERSAFIERPELPSGSGDELERRILRLVSSGEEGVSFTEAESRLKEWQRKLRYNKRGEIPDLEERIAQLRSSSEAIRDKTDELTVKALDLRELEAEHDFLLGELEAHKAADRTATTERLAAAEARLAEAGRDLAEAARILPPGNPSSDELRRLEREIAAESERLRYVEAQSALIAEKHRRIEQAELQLRDCKPFLGCSADEASSLVKREKNLWDGLSDKKEYRNIIRKSVFIMILPILISAYLLYSYPLLYAAPSSVLLIAAVFAVVAGISKSAASKRLRRKKEALLHTYGIADIGELDRTLDHYLEMDRAIRLMKEQESELRRKLDDIAPISPAVVNRIYEVFPSFHSLEDIRAGLRDAVPPAVVAFDKYARAKMLKVSAQQVVDALRAGSGKTEENTSAAARLRAPTLDKAEAAARLTQNERLLASLRRETALIEGSLEKEKLPDELEAEAAILAAKLESLSRGYLAISLALETLGEANRQLRERFSPALNAAAADIFAAFTGSKYNRVVISREFSALAGSGGSEGLRRALELSRGTADQLYLATRFAVSKIVPPPGYTLPVVLDDAFVSFDENRLEAALNWLYEESKTRQILLFTCHKRESEYLSGRPGVVTQSVL